MSAYTLTGTVFTNIRREILDTANFSTGSPRRNWHGMASASQDEASYTRFARPQAVLDGEQRSPGLDVVSKAGNISILVKYELIEKPVRD